MATVKAAVEAAHEPIPINAHNELSSYFRFKSFRCRLAIFLNITCRHRNDFDPKRVKRSCGDLLG
jgi:hypothetical protein